MTTYTAITGWRDALKNQPVSRGEYVAFVDTPFSCGAWTTRPVPHLFADPARNAKMPKILAHQFIEDDKSMWVDASVELFKPAEDFFFNFLEDVDMAFFTHPLDNVFGEAEAVKDRKKDDPVIVDEQIRKYRKINGAQDWPVIAGTIILRKHTEAVARFNEMWWAEICRYSKRDQLSLPHVLRQSGVSYRVIDIPIGSRNDYFYVQSHL